MKRARFRARSLNARRTAPAQQLKKQGNAKKVSCVGYKKLPISDDENVSEQPKMDVRKSRTCVNPPLISPPPSPPNNIHTIVYTVTLVP